MNNILLSIMIIAWLYIMVMWINSIWPIVKRKVIETHYTTKLFRDVDIVHYEYYKKYPFCKWKLYEVQTPEQFDYECRRFRELCHDDWKSYMNFEVDKTIYIID